MYQPPHFIETRQDVLHGLIRAHPLGLLISNGQDGPTANAIPFLLDADVGPNGKLRAHLAKANPQWRLLADNPVSPVLVVFQGPDAYVTPSWYETKRETGKVVPTWNYAIVQVRGTVKVIDDLARHLVAVIGESISAVMPRGALVDEIAPGGEYQKVAIVAWICLGGRSRANRLKDSLFGVKRAG